MQAASERMNLGPKIRGTILGSHYNKDYRIFGVPLFWETTM